MQNQANVPPIADCDLSFIEVARALWGDQWALCRATPRMRARYGRCVSHKEYAVAEQAWAERVHAARAAHGRAHVVGLPITPRLLHALMLEEALQGQREAA